MANFEVMPGECSFDQKFFASAAYSLEANDTKRVMKAVDQFINNPERPSLNLEPIAGRVGTQRLWTIRASQAIRILLARQGPLTIFLRAGRHDEIYRLSTRTAFVAPREEAPGLIPISAAGAGLELPQGGGTPPAALLNSGTHTASIRGQVRPQGEAEASVLGHWSDREVAELGFESNEIALLRRSRIDNLLDVWPEISEDKLDLVLKCCELSPEEWREQELIEDEELANERFRAAIYERGAVADLSDVLNPDEIRRLLEAPLEEWMVFLHPSQRNIVRRRCGGPARIRGAAGTGKTVVALHRTAALAKQFAEELLLGSSPQNPPILFTTYIKNLPPVFESLYRRLPTAVEDAVEFVNIHKLALRFFRKAGHTHRLDVQTANGAFDQAYRLVVAADTPLQRAAITKNYLKDEIEVVLKGMAIDTLEQYLEINRTGRSTPFGAGMRRQVWELREEYERRLREQGSVDFADVLRVARDIVQERQEPAYRAVIVDEAQDLTLVGLQFVTALVTGEDGQVGVNGLLLVGDSAQKIYPGGFTLAEAGIDVRGNSFRLRTNYRNTQQIITMAQACHSRNPQEEPPREQADSDTQQSGVKPQLVNAGDIASQIRYTKEKIEVLCREDSFSRGDVGVLAATNSIVQQAKAHLQRSGLDCQDLEAYTGATNTNVKVGTFHRAKGLEFKVVFILGLTEGEFPQPQRSDQSDAEYDEDKSLQLSQLYVALTRPRDSLFLFYDREPSEVLYNALEHCELVDAR